MLIAASNFLILHTHKKGGEGKGTLERGLVRNLVEADGTNTYFFLFPTLGIGLSLVVGYVSSY